MADHAAFRRLALRTPQGLIASGFGSGLSPFAPGTAGSLAALPFWWFLIQLPMWAYGLVLVLALLIGVWAAQRVGDAVGQTDYGGIVWDEFVGLWIALALTPPEWPWVLAGFLLFRVFDIIKPPPARQLERHVPGGWGVMLDDVAAGFYALGALAAAQALLIGH